MSDCTSSPNEPSKIEPKEKDFVQEISNGFSRKGNVFYCGKKPIANFVAQITCVETHDDSVIQRKFYTIQGILHDGTALPCILASEESFECGKWVTQWAPKAYVFPRKKDEVKFAIQLLSENAQKRIVYKHIGWRKVENHWVYLHNGGSITNEGLRTDISIELSGLEDYCLPEPLVGPQLKEAVTASLSLLDLAPKSITYPLLSATYRAVLGEASPASYVVFLEGLTGTLKSEIQGLCQAHFGKSFCGKLLPSSWTATANAIEIKASLTKDAIFVVDDFVPEKSRKTTSKLHEKAEQVIRSIGNRSARDRATSNLKLASKYLPRSLVMASGEDLPRGHSIRGRMVVLRIEKGDVNLERLTKLQGLAAGAVLSQAMASFIQWIAPRLSDLKRTFSELQSEFRKKLQNQQGHLRTPDSIADLAMGFWFFLQFANACGVVSSKDAEIYWAEAWDTFTKVSRAQVEVQSDEDPCLQYLKCLHAAIVTGTAYVEASTGGQPPEAQNWGWHQGYSDSWFHKGKCIGWIEDDSLFLHPEASFSVAQEMAQRQGEVIPFGKDTLWKRLRERGSIVWNQAEQKNLVKKTINGKRLNVVHFPNKNILLLENGDVSAPQVPSLQQESFEAQQGSLFEETLI